jgi:formylmethanofuran dehydrogenase subunit E
MTLPPRLSKDHIDGLFALGGKPEDVVMPCERCGTMPARKVNLVGEEKRLCAFCNQSYYASNWEIWAS